MAVRAIFIGIALRLAIPAMGAVGVKIPAPVPALVLRAWLRLIGVDAYAVLAGLIGFARWIASLRLFGFVDTYTVLAGLGFIANPIAFAVCIGPAVFIRIRRINADAVAPYKTRRLAGVSRSAGRVGTIRIRVVVVFVTACI